MCRLFAGLFFMENKLNPLMIMVVMPGCDVRIRASGANESE